MKNKKLLFSLLTVVTGIAIFSLSATGTFDKQPLIAGSPDNDAFSASMEYLGSLRNNQVSGTIDAADILRAEQMSLKASGAGLGIDWHSVGPDNFSGRTRAVIYDNQDPGYSTLYAAATSGGLWKSTTGGILWDPIPGTGSIINVTCMVQDANGKIYVGTGETFNVFRFAAYPGFLGSGIYTSDDGASFTRLSSTAPDVNDVAHAWAYVNRIAINPANSQIIYAATHSGLKYSSDGGNTWQYAKNTDGNDLNGQAMDVKIGSNGITVASVNSLVYISESGAYDAFVSASTGTLETLPFASISRSEIAIAPSNPDIIYAVLARGIPSQGQLENVYLSENKGETWRVVGPGGSAFFNVFGSDNVGDYANVIVVHPNDPYIVYIGGKNLWKGSKKLEQGFYEWKNMLGGSGTPEAFINSNHHSYAFRPDNPNVLLIGTDRGIFRSNNDLATYQFISKNYRTVKSYSVAFNSGKRVLTGTQSNGILFMSETGNTEGHATRIDNPSTTGTLNGGHVAMSVIDQKALIWATAIPSSSVNQEIPIYRSNDLGATLSLHAFHPTQTNQRNFLPSMLLWESLNYPQSRDSLTFYADEDLAAGTQVWMRSKNSRYPFKYTLPAAMQSEDSIRVQDIIATKMFYGLQNTSSGFAVFMTHGAMDFTEPPVWYKILTPQGNPQSLGVSKDGNYLWVGTVNGILYRLGNLHEAYDPYTASMDSAGYAIEVLRIDDFNTRAITSVSVDPVNPNHVIVTLGNYGNDHYVYRSTNATAANPVFTSVQGSSLPAMPVYSSLIEMNDPNVVILGTERGIFTTNNINNANPTWTQESGDMGDVAVFQIRQQLINKPAITVPIDSVNFETFPGVDNYGKIYAATYGKGIYHTTRFVGIGELPVYPDKIAQSRLHIYPNPASEVLFIDYNAAKAAQVEVSVIDLSGRIVKQQNFGLLNAGKQTLRFDLGQMKQGVYLIQLSNGETMLSNKLVIR
jgi:hypothetical protein